MIQTAAQKRYGLFLLAIIFFLFGIVGLLLGSNNFAIRTVAVVGFIVGVYLVRMSNVHAGPAPTFEADQFVPTRGKSRPGRLMWMVGVTFLLLAGASFVYLYQDALHGYNEVLPVYLFAGIGLACALIWSYLASKLF
jgi:hypothetical protein